MSVDLDIALAIRLEEGGLRPSFQLDLNLKRSVRILAFFGPSGAGKTLALRTLAGLIRPTEGSIVVDGETWFDSATERWRPAHERRVGYVPQTSALFPHLTLLENVCFGLEPSARRSPPSHVHELMERMGLERLSGSSTRGLSGGERQRVALARALARAPKLLLLDEPMSALDEAARGELRVLLEETIEDLKISTILVTHDAQEAASLADEALLFERGRSAHLIPACDLQPPMDPLEIRGQIKGAPEPLPDGRVRVRFEGATITADPELLERATVDDTAI